MLYIKFYHNFKRIIFLFFMSLIVFLYPYKSSALDKKTDEPLKIELLPLGNFLINNFVVRLDEIEIPPISFACKHGPCGNHAHGRIKKIIEKSNIICSALGNRCFIDNNKTKENLANILARDGVGICVIREGLLIHRAPINSECVKNENIAIQKRIGIWSGVPVNTSDKDIRSNSLSALITWRNLAVFDESRKTIFNATIDYLDNNRFKISNVLDVSIQNILVPNSKVTCSYGPCGEIISNSIQNVLRSQKFNCTFNSSGLLLCVSFYENSPYRLESDLITRGLAICWNHKENNRTNLDADCKNNERFAISERNGMWSRVRNKQNVENILNESLVSWGYIKQ